MKLVNGEWTKVSWDTAIDEIGDKMLQIREESGPDSVYWLGSARQTMSNLIFTENLLPIGGPTT